jgi:hypothetical protein
MTVYRRPFWWALVAAGTTLLALRRVSLRYGASGEEVDASLPGDELLSRAGLSATRAITIGAPAAEVWPWIAQLGQGRGGFYSYDFAENLIGCDIHSAAQIVQRWQDVEVGDQVNLAPEVGLTVAQVIPGRALVLRGGLPVTVTSSSPYDFTWAFVLRPGTDGTARLVVRERYSYTHRWVAALIEPVELVSFVMSRRMLLGIRHRAELRHRHQVARGD